MESRDENDTTNLPQSIRICPLLDQQPHHKVVSVGSWLSGDPSAKLCVGLEK
jgi:hypothetical protein